MDNDVSKVDRLGRAAAASIVRGLAGEPFERFNVYESGVGCINIPFCRAQVGAQATKAMHPRTLQLFNELSSMVLRAAPRVRVPFFLHTKGELCSAARGSLREVVRLSSSCDEGDGHKKDAMEHCGLCTSCLFRRVAVHATYPGEDPTCYRDVASRSHGSYELNLFEGLAAELLTRPTFGELVDLDPDVRFAGDAPFVPPAGVDVEAAVADMFQRYAREVQAFFAQNRPMLAVSNARPQPRRTQYDLFSAAR